LRDNPVVMPITSYFQTLREKVLTLINGRRKKSPD
jgi:hypothetical protein